MTFHSFIDLFDSVMMMIRFDDTIHCSIRFIHWFHPFDGMIPVMIDSNPFDWFYSMMMIHSLNSLSIHSIVHSIVIFILFDWSDYYSIWWYSLSTLLIFILFIYSLIFDHSMMIIRWFIDHVHSIRFYSYSMIHSIPVFEGEFYSFILIPFHSIVIHYSWWYSDDSLTWLFDTFIR